MQSRRSPSNLATIIFTCFCAVLAACGGSGGQTTGLLSQAQIRPLQGEPDLEYRLRPGDVVEIKFFNNERFNRTQEVRPDGRITLERVGDVDVAGKTPTLVDAEITRKFSTFAVEPELTVFVKSFAREQFAVLGSVNKPGVFDLRYGMSLMQAVAAAGGTETGAKLQNAVLMRRMPDGSVKGFRINLNEYHRTSAELSVLKLQADDVLFIPKSFIGNVNQFMTQIYDIVLPPVEAYLRAIWWKR